MKNRAHGFAAGLLVSLVLVACSGGGLEADNPAGVDGALPFRSVVDRSTSGIAEARQQVIRDNATWQPIWSEIHFGAFPGPPLPFVDFETEMLLLVAMGEQPNGCYDNEVEAVEASGATVTVTAVEWEPDAECVCTAQLVQPVQVVAVPRLDAEARFEVERRIRSCG